MKQRRRIPGKVTDRLIAANRHTCCICHEPRQPVEKHHINGDPSDNDWENLAVVCRNCHGLITTSGNLGARYTPGEVLRYKQLWEKYCAEATEQELDSPVQELHETKRIEGGEHELYSFDMEEGDELVFSVDANDCLDLAICEQEDVEAWAAGEIDDDNEEDDRPLPAAYWFRSNVMECSDRCFVAPEDGSYVLLVVNWDNEAIEVTVDAAVWESQE